ncbi:type III polyketide synthase [Cellulomonas bogoriensis]|uniref:Stilbene synthase n=1 Tax=Cellulomonas bogoriensis 69B4 = DSM 16987 TaxID=1386082 RepID=A0A0A0C0K3_9CELL|nr:3-oxoacyl-[acyl-carrier-protein] synthase III C-terminal domain-containing protein [Cellulomonas bogoriensis]KGM13701.1 stilbene synthase [Cellulomonas bogoriensis 69B4 = DSM 16987]
MSRLVALAPVLPPHRHSQHEITRTVAPLLCPDGARAELVRRLHGATGVGSRYLAMPLEKYAHLDSFTRSNALFVELATDLLERAARSALTEASMTPEEVDLVVLTTVTGVAVPSVDVLVARRLGLRQDVTRVPTMGWGCAGGVAGTALVHDHLVGHPGAVALLLSVELCSLTLQHGDDSTPNLVASGLFGDGAAAALLVGEEHPAAGGPQVVGGASHLVAGTESDLGWQVGSSGLRIVLSAGLPDTIALHLHHEVTRFLKGHDLAVEDVAGWVVHAGGPRVLEAVTDALGLPPQALVRSWQSLAEVGNMSSASVLHILRATLDAPVRGPLVMVAFGPGVAIELVLLRTEVG